MPNALSPTPLSRCLGSTPFGSARRPMPSKAWSLASSSSLRPPRPSAACSSGRRANSTACSCAGRARSSGWGAAPRQIDILISTARLNAVVAHRHGDLTATIQAGARLGDVNRALAQHRQWIPLDPPSADSATIGGIVATNDSGPRRHRYGAPRDLIIGVEFARADGRLAKGGGIVVKNVAGYDLPRLLTGSFGSLGVIVTATFKLYPLTAASRTLIVEPSNAVRSRRAGGEAVGEPPDADRARVCDPSAASHHQVRIDRGVRRATV